MSFILVSATGEIQVNAWNWQPTLQLLLAENVVNRKQYELLGANGCGGRVDRETAGRIADAIERRLMSMAPGTRMLADFTVTSDQKTPVVFLPDGNSHDVDVNDLYSASYEWLSDFRDFCRQSDGFEVL